MATNGLVIAGLGSGSGKTTLTLGILRALSRRSPMLLLLLPPVLHLLRRRVLP